MIKDIVKKYKKIWYICRCARRITDEAFVDAVLNLYPNGYDGYDVSNNVTKILLLEKGKYNKGAIIYRYELNVKYGLGSIMHTTINNLYEIDKVGFWPHVVWRGTPYNDPDMFGYEDNAFNYYFYQYNNLTDEIVSRSHRVVAGRFYDGDVDAKLSPKEKHGYEISDYQLHIMGKIYKKYFTLKTEVKDYIYHNIEKIMSKQTMGVHIRMGDMLFGYNNHPKVPTLDEYIEVIMEEWKSGEYEQLFLATDDKRAVKYIKEKFKYTIVIYDDVVRVEGMLTPMNLDSEREKNNYYLGLEILRDMYALSYCKSLISGYSNVPIIAETIKYSRNEEYVYRHIIDKGFSHNNKMADDLNMILKTVEDEKEKLNNRVEADV